MLRRNELDFVRKLLVGARVMCPCELLSVYPGVLADARGVDHRA
jgi:hypothetical protein